MRRLQFSGYGEKFRYEVLKGALRENGGENPSKRVRKRSKKDWYLKGGAHDTVMFVDTTPNESLKKKIEKDAKKNKMKVKVVEKAGRSIKSILQRRDPFDKKRCNREDCIICNEGMNADCRQRGCVYEIECREEGCGCKYIGTTGRSLYERMKEHMNSMGGRHEESRENPLYRHSVDCHQGRQFRINVRVVDKQFGRPSNRLISEAVRIYELDGMKAMNGKSEWSYIKLDKLFEEENY